jgi:hypothetical protein
MLFQKESIHSGIENGILRTLFFQSTKSKLKVLLTSGCWCWADLRWWCCLILNSMKLSEFWTPSLGGGQRHLPMRTVLARPYKSMNGLEPDGSQFSGAGGIGGGGGIDWLLWC